MTDLLQPELDDILSDQESDSAELMPDEENGYDRVVPRPDVVERIEEAYCAAIKKAEKDWEADRREMMRAEAVYEGRGDANDFQSMITIPLAKRVINQQMATLSNAILSKIPVITVKPLDDGTYQIPSQVSNAGAQTQMQMEEVSAVEAARLYQAFLEYKMDRLNFGQLVDDTLYSLHAGENPTYWKIEYEPRTRIIKRKKYVKLSETDNVVKILGYEDLEVPDGEATKILHVFGGNCLLPIEQTDLQRSPWFAEKTPMTTLELWKEIKDGKIDFALGPDAVQPLEKIAEVLGFETPHEEGDIRTTFGMIDNHVADEPERSHDVRTLWFYYPIKRKVQVAGRSTQLIEIRSLCGKLHYPAGCLLSLYVNPYPKRPYIPFFLRKRPHRFSGTSAAQDLAPFQRLISQIFHLQIQNAVQQNIKVFLVREGSLTWRYLKRPENKLRPGLMVPFGDPNDVKAEQLGAPVQSMAGEITYLTSTAQQLTVLPDYSEVPNRLPAATFAQNEAQVKMQPQSVLRAIRRPISEAIGLYLQTVAQYHQYESVPFVNPETNQRVMRLISFPRDVFEQHFSFEITATGDDDTVQARVERGSMLLKETNVENEAAMKLLSLIMAPEMPPETKEPAVKMLVRLEAIYADLLNAVRPDAQKYILTEEFIRGVMAKVPPPQPQPEEKQEEPKIAFNFSAKLSEEVIQLVLQRAGIEVPSGLQLSAEGAGGGPLQPGAGQPAGVPAQPNGLGIPQPNALGNPGSAGQGG